MNAIISNTQSIPNTVANADEGASHWNSLDDHSVKCLVIAHDEPMLARRLSLAVEERSIMWRIPQTDWGCDRQTPSQLTEAILRRADLRRIVLAGHSQGLVAASAPQVIGGGQQEPAAAGPFGSMGLLQRVQAKQHSLQQAKEHFVRQFEQLSSVPEIAERIESGALQLSGVFYIAESGTFQFYNPATRTLEASSPAASTQASPECSVAPGGSRYS